MKLTMKQQFKNGYIYDVFNEDNMSLYKIIKTSSLIKEFKIYKNNKLLGSVRDLRLIFLYGFVFLKDDKKIGNLLEKITLYIPKFNFSPNNWTVISDCFDWNNYKVYDNNDKLIMIVRKRMASITHCYDIEITEQENILYCLMIAISLTTTLRRKRRFR